MSNLEVPDPDVVQNGRPPSIREIRKSINEKRVSHDADPHVDELEKANHTDYNKVDHELAKYAGSGTVEISEEENTRLRRMIDKRVLVVMITTYFLQAIDKGTLTFSSIMGIQTDAGLVGQEYNWLTTCIYITILIVEYPQVSSAAGLNHDRVHLADHENYRTTSSHESPSPSTSVFRSWPGAPSWPAMPPAPALPVS